MAPHLAKHLPATMTLEHRDSLISTAARQAEESRLLRLELQRYRERHGHLVGGKQLARLLRGAFV